MRLTRRSAFAAAAIALFALLGVGQAWLQNVAQAQARTVEAPKFEVDPLWPKPLPNHWVLGMTIGVWVDDQDNVWIIHRGADTLNANERRARAQGRRVLRRGAAGAGVRPGRQPGALLGRARPGLRVAGVATTASRRLQGQRLDRRQRREGCAPAQVHQGRQVPDAGGQARRQTRAATTPRTSAAWPRSGSTRRPTRPTSPTATNKRVAVLDADTGKMKRYWGAYGNKPDDADLGKYDPGGAAGEAVPQPGALRRARQRRPGLRLRPAADRIQVFKPDGTFVKEAQFATEHAAAPARPGTSRSRRTRSRSTSTSPTAPTRSCASILRETLQEITNFGDGGRQPGQFYGVHSIATDSKGNIYTTETYEGKRLQKFVLKGVQQVAAGGQGTPWPGGR